MQEVEITKYEISSLISIRTQQLYHGASSIDPGTPSILPYNIVALVEVLRGLYGQSEYSVALDIVRPGNDVRKVSSLDVRQDLLKMVKTMIKDELENFKKNTIIVNSEKVESIKYINTIILKEKSLLDSNDWKKKLK